MVIFHSYVSLPEGITYDVVITFDIFKMYVMMHHGVSFCTL